MIHWISIYGHTARIIPRKDVLRGANDAYLYAFALEEGPARDSRGRFTGTPDPIRATDGWEDDEALYDCTGRNVACDMDGTPFEYISAAPLTPEEEDEEEFLFGDWIDLSEEELDAWLEFHADTADCDDEDKTPMDDLHPQFVHPDHNDEDETLALTTRDVKKRPEKPDASFEKNHAGHKTRLAFRRAVPLRDLLDPSDWRTDVYLTFDPDAPRLLDEDDASARAVA